MTRVLNKTKHSRMPLRPGLAVALLAFTLQTSGQTGAGKQPVLCLGGQPNAPIKIEVFSDYQCPRCREFYVETLKPLVAEYGKANKVYVVYHDFPLDMHPYARKASRLALAAERISRELWLRVTDAIYLSQDQWSQNGNIEAALAKVMDPAQVARMRKLAADPAIEATLAQEIMLGQSRKITSTPTWFIVSETGRQQIIPGKLPYATLKDYLDRALKR